MIFVKKEMNFFIPNKRIDKKKSVKLTGDNELYFQGRGQISKYLFI